jgi:hypothetical protein
VLLGRSVQVVIGGVEYAFPGYDRSAFNFHSSGLCAVVDGAVLDFPTGIVAELPPDATQVTFF